MNLRDAKIRAAGIAVRGLSNVLPLRTAIGSRIPVLCYHRVLPREREGGVPLFTITPEAFDAQMALLAADGFESLSLDRYADLAAGRGVVPERAVLVTFDDGYADTWHQAWPIAARHGITMNLFVCTGLLTGDIASTYPADDEIEARRAAQPELWRPLSWAEVRSLRDAGVGLGFHSHAHGNHGLLRPEAIAADIAVGVRLLAQETGVRPRTFAFPGGSATTHSRAAVDMLLSRGFERLFTTHLGRTPVGSAVLCARLMVYQQDDLTVFRRKLFGAYDWLGQLRRADQFLRARCQH